MLLWIAGTLLLPTLASAAKSTAPLNQEAVHRYYSDGDFDPAIALLEDFQKTHSRYTHEESLTVYKYLGVMYCADQKTREKGKTYFYKLLKVDPNAKILDMYVSIMVQEIFKGTLEELMGQQTDRQPSSSASASTSTSTSGKNAVASDKLGDKTDDKAPHKDSQTALKEDDKHTWYWWAGGVGLAAGIAGGYYLISQSGHQGTTETDTPVKF
jgi:hypothetical protein